MPRFSTVAEFLDPEKGHRPTEAERKLIAACIEGEPCILGDGTLPNGPSLERNISADLLRLLITGCTATCGLHPSGIWLEGAFVSGTLNLRFTKCRGKCTLKACRFEETPQLQQANLAELSLENSHILGLSAQGIRVEGSLSLRNLTSKGTVAVNRAIIGGQLSCIGAHFDSGGGKSLNAQGVEVTSDFFLNALTAKGTVAMNGAKIGGQVSCSGANLDGGGGKALNAQGVETGKSFFLRDVTSKGTVALNGANIGGQFDCSGACFDGAGRRALNGQRMRVTQGFFFRRLKTIKGQIYLAGAHVADLVDDSSSWPKGDGEVALDGFTYDRISRASTNARDRLPWLKRGSTFDGQFYPQPYSQLAKVLRQMGHGREARQVLIERESLLSMAFRKDRSVLPNGDVGLGFLSVWRDVLNFGHWVADRISYYVAGYGYRPVNSLIALVFLMTAATLLANRTWTEGSFAPNSDVILTSPGWLQAESLDCIPVREAYRGCDPNPALTWSNDPARGLDWDSFNRYGYAADLVVPVLDLGQTDAWAPSKDRGPYGKALWWGRWVLAALGWLVTALGVAAITGIMQRNAPE